MDIVGGFSVLCFLCFMLGHYIGQSERRSRRATVDVHSARDDLEARSRRVQ
ncbi:hypothetical protein IVA94_14650 [Bradyrhizobium sp. 156]|uniref:hypothetical protein n=1 Tax=Bradyrhizobium sp. 156 TaxID=2782630 RepID=UPI001FF8A8F3|nr:hypothetical protein [Bradyrhizobium sp. 156]MCK1322108.1 hypothetical protein [Bradyrhizobium sp. 156]